MRTKFTAVVVAGLFAATANANTFEGSLSNESVKVDVSLSQQTYFMDVGGMYHTDDGSYAYVGAHIEDIETSKDYPLQIGLGARLIAVDADAGSDDTGVAVGLGGFYRYTFPKANRFSVYGSLYYSPKVLSFNNVESLWQGEVRGEYKTLRNARVFIRYGQTSVEFDNLHDTVDMNQGVGLGVVADF
ncbi:YfaZ family outer membrane protein [Marinomonas balearica]|uniref:YfaZ n=1 Tax=Marinomonas balearica TaxID=491947 RepID=A0A4R6M9A4_9GAMM|nr:YfaZ family outer membrane protein [Marinomonas balearica]TDO96759.1 YfaZ precursor [Marinomonas balearica]